MSFLDEIKLADLAKSVIKAYRKVKDKETMSLYSTDITELVTKVLGLDIVYAKISADQSILGLTSFCEYEIEVINENDKVKSVLLNGNNILIESTLKDGGAVGRKNFTIAHEAAHQIINREDSKFYGAKYRHNPIKYSLRERQITKEEKDADKLAALILMPQDSIEYFMKLVELKKITCLNKIYNRKEYNKFCSIANALGVSRQALSIRMKELGYIESEYLRNPYSIVDIYAD